MDSFEFNKIMAAILVALLFIMGVRTLSENIFETEKPEHAAYALPSAEEAPAGGAAEARAVPMEALLNTESADVGEKIFGKCKACHTIEKGGANTTGPNLWGIFGRKVGSVPGFSYSSGVAGHGGAWDFALMDQWLTSPKAAIAGTKMTFAGISRAEDRARLMLWLNKQSDAPLPIPAAPAKEEAAPDAAPADTAGAAAANAAAPVPAPAQ